MDRASGKRGLVTVKRASQPSLFRGVIERMGDEQWGHIIQAALAMRPEDFKGVKMEDGEAAITADNESDDAELLDPRYM